VTVRQTATDARDRREDDRRPLLLGLDALGLEYQRADTKRRALHLQLHPHARIWRRASVAVGIALAVCMRAITRPFAGRGE